MDTGTATSATRENLESELAAYGVSFRDIDTVLLTHWHRDHSGLSPAIQEVSDATIYVHSLDAPLVAGDEDAWSEFHGRIRDRMEEWGVPKEAQERLPNRVWNRTGVADGTRSPAVNTFKHGDTFLVNDLKLEVIHSPGHTAGLSCFVFESDGEPEMFSGDALLPVYTPNVGGADVRLSDPLKQYLGTLSNIVSMGYACAWPGHRDPIRDPTSRAREIIRHHEERAWRVLSVLRNHGSFDAWTMSAELFGDLEGIHILHGPGEAFAHLNHLHRREVIERVDNRYRITQDTIERMDVACSTDAWPLVDTKEDECDATIE